MAVTHDAWVISIRSRVEDEATLCSNDVIKTCIYRVPVWLKEHVCDGNDKTPYTPEIISFGPYHRGEIELAEMEKHKWRCLKIMLRREEQDVEIYLNEMKELENEARAYYEGPLDISSNDFVEMLVLDGCFMLEFLRVIKLGLMHLRYEYNDPVFSKLAIKHVIARDMIKLVNQLPLMVLKRLLEIQYRRHIRSNKHIPRLVLLAFTPIWVNLGILYDEELEVMRETVLSNPRNDMNHCLDIFRSSLLYKPGQPPATTLLRIDQINPPQDGFPDLPSETGGPTPPVVRDDSFTPTPPSRSRQNGSGDGLGPVETNISNEPEVQTGSAVESESFEDASDLSPDDPEEQQRSDFDAEVDGPEDQILLDPDVIALRSLEKMSCLQHVFNKVVKCAGYPELSYEKIRSNSEMMVYCVEDLWQAGVKFEARTGEPYAFWDLKFQNKCGGGLLMIPPIKIDDATKTVFLNLIAYEQCHLRESQDMQITDYVAFMDNLVNSAADVRHLHQAGIIVHQLGSDADVADMFNRLVKKAFVDRKEGKLSTIYRKLNKYCTHKRHRWCANLHQDYMKNPCVIISVICAGILFLLTIAQTVIAIVALP